MGWVLTEQEIQEHLEEKGLRNRHTDQTAVYAQLMPGMREYLLWGAYANLMKGGYFVLCDDGQQLILLPLGRVSGKIDKQLEPLFIQHDEVTAVHLKKGPLMYSVKFFRGKERLPLKITRRVAGLSWHKANLPAFLETAAKLKTAR